MVVVPAKGKGKGKAPAKSAASSKKTPSKTIPKTFMVRAPSTRPIAQAVGKSRSRAVSITSQDEDEVEPEKQDESDFAPEELPSDGDEITDEEIVPTDDEVDLKAEEEEYDDLEPEIAVAKKPSSKGKIKAEDRPGKPEKHKSVSRPCGLIIKPREGDLPPISDLQLIFDDIVSRVPGVTSLFGEKGGRKLRVATMCSGTESPLLALGLIGRALQAKKLGKLEVEHVFSCEIEPYKQA